MKNSVCQKTLFISNLQFFSKQGGDGLRDPVYDRMGYREGRGQRLIASALAEYLRGPSIPAADEFSNWNRGLGKYIADAFVDFRLSERWKELRHRYTLQVGEDLYDPIEAHVGGIHRTISVMGLTHLAACCAEEVWVRDYLYQYFEAQGTCIDHAWFNFVRSGYRQLMPRIKQECHRGNMGTFGSTTLMTYACAGRVTFTFFRQNGDEITYLADADDMHGVRSGRNSSSTPYARCVSMIEEVVANWDSDKMVRADGIGFGL